MLGKPTIFKKPPYLQLGGGFNVFYIHPYYLGRWSNLTNIFQMGWNVETTNQWMNTQYCHIYLKEMCIVSDRIHVACCWVQGIMYNDLSRKMVLV